MLGAKKSKLSGQVPEFRKTVIFFVDLRESVASSQSEPILTLAQERTEVVGPHP